MSGVSPRLTFPVAAVLLLTAVGSAGAEPLGRLFLTPERRATLERQRQLDIEEVQTIEGTTVTLDGVVTRSSGRSTVWVNQQPQNENALGTGVTAIVSRKNPGSVVLTPGDETSTPMKVGETINRGTREKTDALGDGSIAVKPAR